jgi:hypothetical protein
MFVVAVASASRLRRADVEDRRHSFQVDETGCNQLGR